MIRNQIELGSCQAVSQCPSALSGRDGSRFNLGLLEKEVRGYAWYEALTNPGNWVSVGGLILTLISLLVQGVQYYQNKNYGGEAENRTAVGVTITNAPEPAPQRVYVREVAPTVSPAIYGVAELVPLAAAPTLGKWQNPIPPKMR